MALTRRIVSFLALWLLAGVICAIFSDISISAGEEEWIARFQIVYRVPLIAAWAIAFTVGHYTTAIFWLLVAFFVVHAVVALTRRSRRQFAVLLAIQVFFLVASVLSVLYFFHYVAIHMHG